MMNVEALRMEFVLTPCDELQGIFEKAITEVERLQEELSQCAEAMEIGTHPAAQRIMQLESKIKQLEGNFSHFRVDNGINELCALYGLVVINAVHLGSR